MRLSSFSLCFVSLPMLRCFELIRLFEGLFCSTRAKTTASAVFLRRVFFFFSASFTYLELLYLRYFTSTVFLSACLILRYRNAVCLMRFTQLIHFVLQFVVSGILIFSARLLGIIGVTSLVLILISLSFGS